MLDLDARLIRFDVVCAGEALWAMARGRGLALRPSGGAVSVALALAGRGLRVGLAASVVDDAHGRALVSAVQGAGVDTGGVILAPAGRSLYLAERAGEGRRVVPFRVEDEPPIVVPDGWRATLLLLSGLSPALGRAAGLCKAARAARRHGGIVVVDVNARRHAWYGHDPRAIRAPLREADVVRASTEDLAALALGEGDLRAAMREEATLVLTHGAGPARAVGVFGEVAVPPEKVMTASAGGAGDAFTAAICAELVRAGEPGADRAALWDSALRQGHAAARARMTAAA